MQYFLQLCNNAEQYCYIVHFMLQICKMCPHTVFKWRSPMLKSIVLLLGDTKTKKIKNFRKLAYFNRNNMISMTGFSLVGFNEELA